MGSFGGTFNSNALPQSNASINGIAAIVIRALNPTVLTTTIYYVISGYYAAGAITERWVSVYPTSPPPSGHTLQDVEVEGMWTVQA